MLTGQIPGVILEARLRRPEAFAEAAAARRRRASPAGEDGRLFLVAADHPARGALGAGTDAMAMANRADLLARLITALANPAVDGVLGTADVIEDLLLLGALDDKIVIGSMNRGGLAGSAFEADDRFTGYDAAAIAAAGLDGGKMLLRIDLADPATAATLESAARAVNELADRALMAMIEPFISYREPAEDGGPGRLRNDTSTEAVITSAAIASGLGRTSAYTWLKLPAAEDMQRVAAASTLPVVLLGGEVTGEPDATFARWRTALALPSVRGLVAGRSLLYPPDGDVSAAVGRAASLVRERDGGTKGEAS
ncbi:MAG TPA: aldolase [Streptosporangiaceae bacterium]|nr:aldolase [Streptosporangiaceae bacterium]